MDKRRVVITGMGALTSLGNSVPELWDALKQGKSGITNITKFDASTYRSQIAGEVKDLDLESVLDRRELKRMDPFSKYAIYTSEEAIKNAGISSDNIEDEFRVGVIVGSGIGGIHALEEQNKIYIEKGHSRISPFYITSMIIDIASGHISMRHGFRGPNYATVSACATGVHAIGASYNHIVYGDADVMVAGGSESSITPTSIAGFDNIKALSAHNDEPEKASRPFDAGRDGFVMSEGCGIVVLEELEHAKKRGATIYGELAGYGFSADAYHITAPHPDGIGAARAMTNAVEKAGMKLEDVEYINAHGTSTPHGDIAETNAIKTAFGDHAYKLLISSTKSMVGHMIGAAGAIELIATILTIKDEFIPPTINIENQDPACDLNYVPNKGIEKAVQFALSNSFGFGGHNATLAVKKYED